MDQKLISSLLDLSRNVDKLSGDIKKNTETTSNLTETQAKSAGDTKDLGKIAESIKGLDLGSLKGEFSQLTKSMSGLDFQGLSKDLKSLDFKGLTQGIKGLDFKELTQGIKGLDFKSLGQDLKKLDFKDLAGTIKGLDVKGIAGAAKGLDIGGIAGAVKDGGIKNVVSGSLGGLAKGFGKNLLGGFAAGGNVEKTGNYLVGEKGPEIVNLTKGAAVIPNNMLGINNNILKERQNILKKLGSDAPSEKEISKKRNELLAADPEFYKDDLDWLEEDVNSYLEGLQGKSTSEFTQDDLKKLSKPVDNKAETVVSPVNKAPEPKSEVKEKKDGLFSKIFGKKKDETASKVEEKPKGPSIFDKGKDLLKNIDKESLIKGGQDLLKNPVDLLKNAPGIKSGQDLLKNPADLLKNASGIGLQSALKKVDGIKPAEIKNTVGKLTKLPEQKLQAKSLPAVAKAADQVSKISDTITNPAEPKKDESSPAASQSSTSSKPAASPGEGVNKDDMTEIKSLLMRMASLLEGPLSVSSIDSPYRPDSRRI